MKVNPLMVKREKIRGTGRLKDTTDDLAVRSLHKLKTKCLMERCGEGNLSSHGIGILLLTVLFYKSATVIHEA